MGVGGFVSQRCRCRRLRRRRRRRRRHARRRGGAADAASILALALATPALARARPRGGPSPGPVGHRDPTRRFHCWSSPRGTRQAHCWTRHASQRAHFWARALLHGRSIAGPAARARGGGWSGIRGRSSAMRDAAATRGAATAAARIQTVGAHRARSSQNIPAQCRGSYRNNVTVNRYNGHIKGTNPIVRHVLSLTCTLIRMRGNQHVQKHAATQPLHDSNTRARAPNLVAS